MKDFNIVSSYSDDDAVEDGIVCDITKLKRQFKLNGKLVNRVTNTVIAEFEESVKETSDKPHLNNLILAAVMDYMLQTLTMRAVDTDGDGYMYVVKTNEQNEPMKPYWFIENEVGGYTLMRPEDY